VLLLAYPFLKIENAKQIRGEFPHQWNENANYPRAAAAALRAIGAVSPDLPKRADRSFPRENNMLMNPLTGKKMTTTNRPKSRLSSPSLASVSARQIRQSGSQDLAPESLEL
jgi:hypothetical protein